MPIQATHCKTAIAPGKSPDHVDPIRFQGSPVNAWPRIHSAAVQAIANPKTRAAPDKRSYLLVIFTIRKAAPVYSAKAAGSPKAAIGTSHQKVAISTKSAPEIQYSPATKKPKPKA